MDLFCLFFDFAAYGFTSFENGGKTDIASAGTDINAKFEDRLTLGDLNGDKTISEEDIDNVLFFLNNGAYDPAFDMDQDCDNDIADYAIFKRNLNICGIVLNGDVNCDEVDVLSGG